MSHRANQIARDIQRHLSRIIQEERPLEMNGLLTITDVDLDPGLERAIIYVSSLPENPDVARKLGHHAKEFARLLSREIRLKKFPLLMFQYDASSQRVQRLEQLLREEFHKN